MSIRAVIFDLDDTLVRGDRSPVPGAPEATASLGQMGLSVVVASGRRPRRDCAEILRRAGIHFDLIVTTAEAGAKKGSPRFITWPCEQLGIEPSKSIYVGHSKHEMISASHARVIFLKATWAPSDHPYGLPIENPRKVVQIVSRYFIKTHLWYWKLDCQDAGRRPVMVRCLIDGNGAGDPNIKANLIKLLKQKQQPKVRGESLLEFVVYHFLGSLYLDGLHDQLDYWTIYPGSSPASPNPVINGLLDIGAKLFRDRFLADLLVRHKSARKSAYLRRRQETPPFAEQVSTVHLNPDYADRLKGRRVLVIDDFSTEGNAFECARNLLVQAGVQHVACAAIGKYGSSYRTQCPRQGTVLKSFEPNSLTDAAFASVSFRGVVNPDAAQLFKDTYGTLGTERC